MSNHTDMGPDFVHTTDTFDKSWLSNVCLCRVPTKAVPQSEPTGPTEYHKALVGDTVNYIGYKWKVIEILPQGSRVMHRPWWKLRKIGVVIA